MRETKRSRKPFKIAVGQTVRLKRDDRFCMIGSELGQDTIGEFAARDWIITIIPKIIGDPYVVLTDKKDGWAIIVLLDAIIDPRDARSAQLEKDIEYLNSEAERFCAIAQDLKKEALAVKKEIDKLDV